MCAKKSCRLNQYLTTLCVMNQLVEPHGSTQLHRLSRLGMLTDALFKRWLRARAARATRDGYDDLAVSGRDMIGSDVLTDGLYERALLKTLFDDLLAPRAKEFSEGVAVDVGANIGNHSLFFSHRFSKVLAFEPNPTAVHFLRGNINLNDAGNVDVHTFGLSDQSRTAFLGMREGNNIGSGSMLADRTSESLSIEVKTLDEVLESDYEDETIRLIKIDVEGHELGVLRGAGKLLKKQKPILLFEVAGKYGEAGSDAVLQFLREVGYRGFFTVAKDHPLPELRSKASRIMVRLILGASYEMRRWDTLDDRFYNAVIATESEDYFS